MNPANGEKIIASLSYWRERGGVRVGIKYNLPPHLYPLPTGERNEEYFR
jgi:hypothetical protein